MTKFITIMLTLFLYLNGWGQDNVIDSTVYLSFNNKKHECIKRYIKYSTDLNTNEIIREYDPPLFGGYYHKNFSDNHYIKTSNHTEYQYGNSSNGEFIVFDKYETDSVFASKFFGKIDKDSLLSMLTDTIYFIDTKKTVLVNENFNIGIVSQGDFTRLSAGMHQWDTFLKYEFDLLQKGDFIIISDINFTGTVSQFSKYIYPGYWEIR